MGFYEWPPDGVKGFTCYPLSNAGAPGHRIVAGKGSGAVAGKAVVRSLDEEGTGDSELPSTGWTGARADH